MNYVNGLLNADDYSDNSHKTTHIDKHIPTKWKKHLVLVQWKLRYMDDLTRSIKRFSAYDYELFASSVVQEYENSPNGLIVIVKFVYPDEFYRLPNFTIKEPVDITKVQDIIAGDVGKKISEIWYCKNICRGKSRTAFGRLLISNSSMFPRCSLHYDIVCSASARVIEDFPHISVPFISVNRDNWNGELHFENIIPGDVGENFIINLAHNAIRRVSAYTPEIIDFARYIFSLGCNHLCLEFSISGNFFQFIDWDSDNDILVITHMFK